MLDLNILYYITAINKIYITYDRTIFVHAAAEPRTNFYALTVGLASRFMHNGSRPYGVRKKVAT